MPVHPIGVRLRALRKQKRRNMKELSLAAKLGETYVRDLETGRSNNPQAMDVAKLARELGINVSELYPAGIRRTPTLGDRMAAVRRIHTRGQAEEESLAEVAQRLSTTPDVLAKIEANEIEPKLDLLLQFCGLMHVPLAFIEAGVSRGLQLAEAAWLAHLYPELVSDLLEAVQDAGEADFA